jgi:hypothetical protein
VKGTQPRIQTDRLHQLKEKTMDEELRGAERRALSNSDDPHDRAAYVAERLRSGALQGWQVRLAALLGDPASRLLTETGTGIFAPPACDALIAAVSPGGRRAVIWLASELAACAADRATASVVHVALEAASAAGAWARTPSAANRDAAESAALKCTDTRVLNSPEDACVLATAEAAAGAVGGGSHAALKRALEATLAAYTISNSWSADGEGPSTCAEAEERQAEVEEDSWHEVCSSLRQVTVATLGA